MQDQGRDRKVRSEIFETFGILRHRFDARGDRHESHQSDQPERQRIGRHRYRGALDHVAARGRQHAGHRMGIEQQRQGRTKRQRGIAGIGAETCCGRRGQDHSCFRRRKDGAKAAELGRNDDHHRQHRAVDQDVLDHRDHRRRAQAARIGVGGENRKRAEQRQIDRHPADMGGDVKPQRRDHHFDADQLQRDIGHGGDDAGNGDGQRQAAAAEPGAHEIGRRDIAVAVTHRPQPRQHHEQKRPHQNGIRHGEKAGGPGAEQQRGHRDEGVGGIEIAAEQEPADDAAEAPPAQSPFVELIEIAAPPACRDEPQNRDQREQGHENCHRHRIGLHGSCLRSSQ